MFESNVNEKLISLGRFNSPTEGAIARARLEEEGIEAQLGTDATATWLNYMGPTIAAAELWVREQDGTRASEILAEVRQHHETEAISADDEEDHEPTPPIVRAFRAAVIGWFLLPPFLNFYSAWLIARHRLWQTDDDFRFYGAIFFNIIGFGMGWWLWLR